MPSDPKLMIRVRAVPGIHREPMTIAAGIRAAPSMAYGGTCREALNFFRIRLPRIMSSRA